MPDIFISYARSDRQRVEPAKVALEELGLEVFFDIVGLDGGDSFPDVLDRAVKSAKVVVGCWTPQALSRDWVKTECAIAMECKTLVPLEFEKITAMDVPAAFYNLHRVNLTTWQGEHKHEGWLAAARALSRRMNRPEILDRANAAAAIPSNFRPQRTLPHSEMDNLWHSWAKLASTSDKPSLEALREQASGTIIEALAASRLEDLKRPAAARMLSGSQALGRPPRRGWRLVSFVGLRAGLVAAVIGGGAYGVQKVVSADRAVTVAEAETAAIKAEIERLKAESQTLSSESAKVNLVAERLDDPTTRDQAEQVAGQLARSAAIIDDDLELPKVGTLFEPATLLNLRAAPNVNGEILATLPKGQTVAFMDAPADPDWWRVQIKANDGNYVGFVARKYLTLKYVQTSPTSPVGVSQLLRDPTSSYSQLQLFAGPIVSQIISAPEWSSMLSVMESEGILANEKRFTQFMAQMAHESNHFRTREENMNYSGNGLWQVFSKYFKDEQEAQSFSRQPERIANRVYANRLGNGDEASGDGWRYRGRGILQMTGKSNYQRYGDKLGVNLVDNPDQLATDVVLAIRVACAYWNERNLNAMADKDDIRAVTKSISGGYNGLASREKNLERARSIWGS